MRTGAFGIVLKQSVLKEIRRIPVIMLERIRSHIAALAENPFPAGVEKIQGYDDCYRIRVGQYRVVYQVSDAIHIITIIRIGHRREVYRF
ncbi:MAG: type II toxin-antitoxin system mRNA interferase toxin, RelE/StbE family [Candidatus Peregrinibacteria bacterium]